MSNDNEAASVAQWTDERIDQMWGDAWKSLKGPISYTLAVRAFARALLAQAAPPAAPVQDASAANDIQEALDWIDDFIARCNGDDRGACESVNVLRRALDAAPAAPPAAPAQGDALRAALQRLEVACDRRSRLLTADAYNAASALPGMTDALLELDEAREEARSLLAAPFASQPAAGERFIAIAARRSLTTDEVAEFRALLAAPAAPVQGDALTQDALRAALQLIAETFHGQTGTAATMQGIARSALLAAPAAPATEKSGADYCTEENCRRCRTPKELRTPEMFHAGLGAYPTPPAAEAASQPGEMGAGVPTECQTVFGEPCQYARDIASGRVHCIHCDRDKPASAQQDEREACQQCKPYRDATGELVAPLCRCKSSQQVQAGGEDKRPQTAAARDVLAERRRQVEAEGWTPEHDDVHANFDMANAAACYAMADDWTEEEGTPEHWPWAPHWWKPKSARQNLVRAGALILAEIERRDRAALSREQPQGDSNG